MSRMFTFQTSAAKTTIQDLEEDKDSSWVVNGWLFPKGSLDESFGVVLIDPKNHTYCVRCTDDTAACPTGFTAFSDPQIAPFNMSEDKKDVK
jgi:hypothetical protein